MKRSILLALASFALAGSIGCNSDSQRAPSAPPKESPAAETSAAPQTESPWTLAPAVADGSSQTGERWQSSPYAPVGNTVSQPDDQPESQPASETGSPGASDPGAASVEAQADSPPAPAAAPTYDPPLYSPGYGRNSADAYPSRSEPRVRAMGESNPLRTDAVGSEPADPNPLRHSQPRAFHSFAAPAPPAGEEPAGGSAPPASALMLDESAPRSAALAAPPPNTYSAGSATESEATVGPEAATQPADSAATSPVDDAEAANMARMAMGEPPLTQPNQNEPSRASQPSSPGQPFHTVKVFYGTDRLAWQPHQDTWASIGLRFWPALAALSATLLFGFIAAMWRHWLSTSLSICSLMVAGLIGYTAASETLERDRIAQKEGVRYINERAPEGEVQLGFCEVTIPKTHDPGELESPSVVRLEVRENKAKHVVLQKTERLADDEFYGQLRERVASSQSEELFVFIHGFNVSFEDAARRTAQMAHDLKYDGAPVFYSWPANQKFLLTYAQDETNVSWAAPHLKRFLLDVARNSNAKSINVVAHSMGNRALTTVLREIELEFQEDSRLFNQVVLAAPDIDADDFRLNIAPFIQKTSRRITLYASSNDHALAASQLVHRYPRAGDSGEVLLVVPGIETVDVSAIDGGPWGHSYYGSSDPILRDLAVLFRGADGLPRSWLTPQNRDGLSYWVFQAQAASARAAGADASLR